MSPRKLTAPFALAVTAGLFASSLTAGVAHAGHGPGPKPAQVSYHIKVALASHAPLNIYANTGCGGSIHILQPNQSATSLGWDSGRMNGINGVRTVNVRIYDDKTGAYLATRTYRAGQCFNISDNTHIVQGLR